MKVLIATPCYGGNVTDLYTRSIIGLIHSSYARGVQVDVLALSGESLITRARNDMLATFWGGDWTDLLWIDGDVGFSPENVWRLLESGHDIAAKSYPIKRLDWDAVSVMDSAADAQAASVLDVVNYQPGALVGGDGFAPVIDAGTGFMRMSRDAVELLLLQYGEHIAYTPEGAPGETRWALFDTFIHDGRYLSEDYALCRRWQAMGGEVMVDTAGPQLQHRGLYTYGS